MQITRWGSWVGFVLTSVLLAQACGDERLAPPPGTTMQHQQPSRPKEEGNQAGNEETSEPETEPEQEPDPKPTPGKTPRMVDLVGAWTACVAGPSGPFAGVTYNVAYYSNKRVVTNRMVHGESTCRRAGYRLGPVTEEFALGKPALDDLAYRQMWVSPVGRPNQRQYYLIKIEADELTLASKKGARPIDRASDATVFHKYSRK